MMLRAGIIAGLLLPGIALAEEVCPAEVGAFVAVMGPDKDGLFRRDLEEATASEEVRLQVQRIDALLPAERRGALRDLAGAL